MAAEFDDQLDGNAHYVLMVDDEFAIHDVVNKTLNDVCCVVSVENGEDALMAAEYWKPDIILLDVDMPGMGGYETCRLFKGKEDFSDIPVMFLSELNTNEDRIRGYDAGGQDFIHKPLESSELRAKVLYLMEVVRQRNEFKSMADFATNTAMTTMTCLSEMGVLLEVMN